SLFVLVFVSPVASADEKDKINVFSADSISQQMQEDYGELTNAVAAAKGNDFKREKAIKEFSKKWNDKWTRNKLRVNGKVETIGIFWKKEWTKVSMQIDESWVSFIFEKKEAERAKLLDTGQVVTIEGTVMKLEDIVKFKGQGKDFFLI